MRRFLTVAALLTLAGCDIQLGDTNGPLSSTWRYRANGVPAMPSLDRSAVCDYDILLTLTQSDELVVGSARPTAEVLCRSVAGKQRRALTSTRVHGEIRGGELHLVVDGTLHSVGSVTGDRVHGRVIVYGWREPKEEMPRSDATFTMERL